MLKDIVKVHINKTNQEIIDYLNTDVTIKTDNTLYSISQVKIAINNIDALRLVLGTIKAVGEQDPLVWGFSQKIMSTGISFADAETQLMIDTLAQVGQWPDAVRDAIKSIGIVYGKKWQTEYLPSLPTVEEIEAVRAEINESIAIETFVNTLINSLSDINRIIAEQINEILNPAISNNIPIVNIKSQISMTSIETVVNNIKDMLK